MKPSIDQGDDFPQGRQRSLPLIRTVGGWAAAAHPAQRSVQMAGRPGGVVASLVRDRFIERRQVRARVTQRELDDGYAKEMAELEFFRNRHFGERCVIIGNGPSLRETPVELLRDEFTFGLNRVYLAFEDWGFSTTYHVAVNKFVAEQSGSELAGISSPLFSTMPNRGVIPARTSPAFFLANDRAPGFYGDIRTGIWEGATVTYVAMQIAFFMGFRQVVLVGVDHRFATKGEPHKLIESQEPDQNHFDKAYFGPGYRWQLPDLETSEMAYLLARSAFSRSGGAIVDSTVNGALTVFPKVPLTSALS